MIFFFFLSTQLFRKRFKMGVCVRDTDRDIVSMYLLLRTSDFIHRVTLFTLLSEWRKVTRRADRMITGKGCVSLHKCKPVNQPLASLSAGYHFPLEPIRLNYGKGTHNCGVCVSEVIPPDSCLLSDNSPSLWKSSFPLLAAVGFS